MNEPTETRSVLWRRRLQRIGSRARRAAPFASGVLASLLALWLYNVLVPRPPQLTLGEVNDSVAQAMASATVPPAFSAQVYQAIQMSLVLIETQGAGEEGEGGLGSGVIVDDAGDILTSLHVVAGAAEIQITFADGTRASAEIIGAQPENDIAVLHPSQLPQQVVPAVLGNPYAMRVGDEAFVVGNPFGLYSSMSAGVISGFERSFQLPDSDQEIDGLIQIDAAVNPGNSGGPLLNRAGQVIGIVTAIVNPIEERFFIGIGFAVPIDVAGGAAGLPPD